jgi:hypothetical protein
VGIPSPGIPVRSLGARRAEIPMQARDLGDGTSGLKPPGGGGGAWVFDNASGVVRICDTTAVDTAGLALANINNCGDELYQFVSGFVRFSLVDPPDAVAPSSVAQDVQVTIDQYAADGTFVRTVPCTELRLPFSLYVSYACTVPVGDNPLTVKWWGRSTVDVAPVAPASRLCRYGPDPALVVPADVTNAEHPRDYVAVDGPLGNQNFLVVPDTADCPATTWVHP